MFKAKSDCIKDSVYIDLGKTGTNFNRDAFGRLMQEIRLGEINCVIVKDLSRFGRNYLEAGNYIEKIFPFLGVRFIAVADGYDTGAEGNDTKKMALEIKNLINDMYAKDFSKKAKTGLRQRREEDSYVGGPPPYGYTASWEGGIRKLVLDENTADIVSYIYERFLETECYAAVTDDLNRKRLNPPLIYKRTKEVYCPPDRTYKGWDKGSVERILKSETYTGKLVQGQTSITARDEKNRIHKDPSEWVVTEHAHEGLISRDIFEKAEKIRHRIRQETEEICHTDGCPIGENIFDGVLCCGVCGRKMTRLSRVKQYMDGAKARVEGYCCLDSISTKKTACQTSNRISKSELSSVLFVLIEQEFSMNLGKRKTYLEKSGENIKQRKRELEQKLHQTECRLLALKEEEGRKYMEYRTGAITQKEYVAYKMQKEALLAELEETKSRLSEKQVQLQKNGEIYIKAVRSLLRWKKERELTKELIEALIEKNLHISRQAGGGGVSIYGCLHKGGELNGDRKKTACHVPAPVHGGQAKGEWKRGNTKRKQQHRQPEENDPGVYTCRSGAVKIRNC